mgnify:CR=1 FL=1
MSALSGIRNAVRFTDTENLGQQPTQSSTNAGQSLALNAVDAAFETANAIPAVNKFSGIGSMVYGAGKLVASGAMGLMGAFMHDKNPGARLLLSGLKSIGSGVAAVLPVPGLGTAVNAPLAAVDGAHLINDAIPQKDG